MFNSLLDTDLYKLTMQQAVCSKFPYAQAKFKFINRGKHEFTIEMFSDIQDAVDNMENLALTGDEWGWLRRTCPFLTPVYLDFLKGFRFDSSEVRMSYCQSKKDIDITISGPWYRTILWEVPIMAIISEVYNKHANPTYVYNDKKDFDKFQKLEQEDVVFADFGSRRRINSQNHERIVSIARTSKAFVGTSNVYLAYKYNLKPIGTHAHEWFMFHGAKYGYKEANRMALKHWTEVYHGNLGIALSDTYTTERFFQDFGSRYARLFDGVRHDSGDAQEFADSVILHYELLGIDPLTKTIVFSDGLNVDKAIKIKEHCNGKIKCSFGIGTHLTNDIADVKPMNMVIKMTACKPYKATEWQQTVKLSDVEGKNTGDKAEIDLCRRSLKI